MQLLASLSLKGKITLAACALGFLAAAMMVVKMAGAPAYSTVMTGLDPAKTTKVTAALDAKGIGYELQNNGTALAVDKAQMVDAKAALAGAGVSATAEQPGYELLDKQKLGASSMQQQVAYQRALEGQIAQTVSQIDGVGSATVRITLPKDDLFADEEKLATAAVLLGGDAATLEPGAVRGIASLVSSSVEGLKTSAVTITDAAGQLMWPGAEGGDGSLASKPAAEARYASQVETSLNAMLSRTLGPDKAQVQVRADLNVDQATREQLEYANRGTPLSATEETETLEGGNAAGGSAGSASNIPSLAGTAGGGSGSNYERKNKKTDFGVNKTVTRTKVAPGAVNKLSVSVLVDRNAKADVAAITKAVETAAGTDAARGDLVSVQEVAFAKLPEPAKPTPDALPVPPQFKPILSAAGVGLAVLLFLFFLTRHLKRKESEELADGPEWLRSLEAPVPVAALAGGAPDTGMSEAARAFQNDPRRVQLEEIVAREPDRVANQLRSWITEDAK